MFCDVCLRPRVYIRLTRQGARRAAPLRQRQRHRGRSLAEMFGFGLGGLGGLGGGGPGGGGGVFEQRYRAYPVSFIDKVCALGLWSTATLGQGESGDLAGSRDHSERLCTGRRRRERQALAAREPAWHAPGQICTPSAPLRSCGRRAVVGGAYVVFLCVYEGGWVCGGRGGDASRCKSLRSSDGVARARRRICVALLRRLPAPVAHAGASWRHAVHAGPSCERLGTGAQPCPH